VHYVKDAKGRIADVHIQAGPHATPRDIELHARTVKTMKRYSGASFHAQRLVDKIEGRIKGHGTLEVGSKAWEANLEVKKLKRIIADRSKLAQNGNALTLEQKNKLDADVTHLEHQLKHYEHDLKAGDKSKGKGHVAAEGKDEENSSRGTGQNRTPNDFLLEDGVTLNNKYRHRVRELFTAENLQFSSSLPTSKDTKSLQDVRDSFSGEGTHGQFSGKDRRKIKDGQKSVSFAELSIEGLPEKLRGVSTEKPLVGQSFSDVPAFVPPGQRQLKSLEFEGSALQPAADGEAKMAEYIYRGTNASSTGTIRLVTDRPACDSCAYVLANLAKQRPGLKIEVVETPRQ
jgi:The  BURPS668_1122 family of deaminases